jgi:hypothetical protein
MQITIRELRHLLTDLDNQEMKVRELRKALFDCNDQDVELSDMWDWPTETGIEQPLVFSSPEETQS